MAGLRRGVVLATVLALGAALAPARGLAEPDRAEPAAPAPPDRFPRAAAAYLVALDGRELWARDADRPRPPASLTKIMTALVALEGGWDPTVVAPVSPRAARATGTRLGLQAGERLRAGDLLAATLVASANDACLALAEHVAGGEAAFVARMNARAAALGLRATTFENACGHDGPGQRSSARDLLALTRAALAHPEVRRLAALERVTLRTEGGRELAVRTTNALLGRLEGARGVKTGYTPAAGRCVVALVERGGAELLLVLLDAADRWWAAAGLVEKAFDEARRGG
jgi:serine-type D-Ala-D-Ala carboxypeptidase (penicillin-binding protein 5/6)